MIVKVAVPEKFKLKVVPDFRTLIFGGQKEIHYIGGTDVLPPPLENEKEEEVIGRLGTEDDQEAKKLLIEHNLRLVVYIAKKFDNTGVGVEDLISIGTIGLIKAINTFNPTKKIKLATYASRCIENDILMYLHPSPECQIKGAHFHPSPHSVVHLWKPPALSCCFCEDTSGFHFQYIWMHRLQV